MTTGAPLLQFGDEALGFVQEELEIAARDFEGPLAAGLIGLKLEAPFSFLSPAVGQVAHNWRAGGLNDNSSDQRLAIAISQWLRQPDAGRRRLMALEEPIARHIDPIVDPRVLHFGERIYHSAYPNDSPQDIEHVFGQLAGYPGVGVLSRLPASALALESQNEALLAAIADAAAAVLVRAWDDEGFLVVPVHGSLAPGELVYQ